MRYEANSLLAAAVALVAFGVVWLSVRGQHPYKGPTAIALVALYAVVAIRIATLVYAHRHGDAARIRSGHQGPNGNVLFEPLQQFGASLFA